MNIVGGATSLRANMGWLALLSAFVIVGVALAIALPSFMTTAALTTGEQAIFADYLSAILLAAVFGIAILSFPVEGDKINLFLLWVVKAVVTLFLFPVVQSHYSGDAIMYFGIGALAHSPLPPLFLGGGTQTTIWLIHWVTRVLPPYFNLLQLLWSFIGLLAIYAFYRGWRWLIPSLDSRFLLWIGLFPGILFWSSLLGKDPVVLLGIGCYFYGMAKWYTTRRARLLFVVALGILIASAIRPWLAVILVAPLVAFPLTSRRFSGWQKILLLGVVLTCVVYAAQIFLRAFEITNLQDLILTANTVSQHTSQGNSALRLSGFHSGVGMLLFLPLGMFTALFRPLPGEVGSIFGLINGLVNAVLLVFTVLTIRRTPFRALREPWLLWIVLLILIWAVMYAIPSQNLGGVSRDELQILPALWPLVLIGAIKVSRYGLRPLALSILK